MVDHYIHRYGGRFVGNRYGAGRGQILLDEVACNGMETSVEFCQHDGWGTSDCEHNEDVSVSCIAGIVTHRSQC